MSNIMTHSDEDYYFALEGYHHYKDQCKEKDREIIRLHMEIIRLKMRGN